MGSYLIRRLLLFIPTLGLVAVVIFILLRLVPGDPALLILEGTEEAVGSYTQDDLAILRRELGTDRPIYVQFGAWVWGLVRGDLGKSLWDRVPVMDEIKKRFPVTIQLAIMAIVIAVTIAVPLGVISAVKQDSRFDYVIKVLTISGVAAPTFWIGILVIVFLAKGFNWLPPIVFARLWEDPLTNLTQLMLPAMALGYHDLAFITRVTRSSTLEVLREDYIRTARAKGLKENVILLRHALKNASLPVLTVAGLRLGGLMGGVVLIEAIFLVPGTGYLLIESIGRQDYPYIQALVLLAALVVVTANLVVDILYGWLDPRIRYA